MDPVVVVFDIKDSAPTLYDFMASDHAARLAVGPFGSGKSSACMMEFLRRAMKQAPGPDGIRRTRFAAIRNTYRELEDTTRKTFEEWIPGGLGYWEEADFTFHLDFNDVRSDILFRSLDKPKDVKKLLSLELTGAYVNEWREIPKEIFEGLTGRVGRYPSMRTGGPTWSGIWGDTNPWHPTHWLPALLRKYPEAIQVFRQPGGRSPQAENTKNLRPGYYDRLMIGKDAAWISVYVDGQDATAVEGSVHGALLAKLRARQGVSDFQHDNTEVFTAWDLGIADSMAIWWFRFNSKRGVDVIDWYENSGHGLQHYFGVLDSKPYKHLIHFLPHDARARSVETGHSTVETFIEKYGANGVSIAPELSVDDGISAARWLLEQPTTRFHSRCDEIPGDAELSGIGTLAEYRFAWDETNKVFSKLPLHNYASHTADAFRYLACAVKESELLTRKPVAPEDPPRGPERATLDELWADSDREWDRRHRG